MKKKTTIELSVRELRPALTGLAKVISRKCTLPVLGCVRIEPDPVDPEKILLTGTDLDTWLSLSITGKVIHSEDQAFPLLIPLTDLREASKGGDVKDGLSIQQENSDHVSLFRHIGTGIVSRSAECENVADYPESPKIKGEPFELDGHAQDALQQAMCCCGNDPSRHVLQGALLEEGKTFVGTDGRHLYCSNSMELPVEKSAILAHHKIMDWPYLSKSTDWKLTVSKKWFRLSGENWQVSSRLLEGNYPNWRQVIPQETEYRSSIEFAPGSLDQVCTTIASMPGEKQNSKPVGLCLTRSACSLLAKGDDEGASSEVSVPSAKTTGPDVSVFLNRDYLTKALGFGLNCIDIIDEKSPVRFRSSEAGSRDMIVMPVRDHGASSAEPQAEQAQPEQNQPEPQPERKKQEMKNISSSNGGSSRQPQTDPTPAPLDEAVARINEVKDLLRQAVGGLNETVGSLKHMKAEQKTTERELKQVRSTIQSLQKVKF